MNRTAENYNIQKKLVAITIILFAIKILAWYLTSSVAILTDALEYTINVVSGLVGLYSLYLSSLPRDTNHPYGHGKVEFLSAAIEGTLMVVSGFLIIYEGINNLQHPHEISRLDYGIYLVIFTAVINYLMGYYAIKKGKKNKSVALEATGKHMQSDTYATIGIIVGLILIYIFHYTWIDSIVAILFAFIIIVSGYKILRGSVAGIMDEADHKLLNQVVNVLQTNRREAWVDLHNLRIIKYGGTLHLDCHLTVPWYYNVHEAHREIDHLDLLIKENFGPSVEMFVHTDGCLDFSCKICTLPDCPERKHECVKIIDWDIENMSSNNKHRMG
ncbi:MAG: cation diffusion facilitator family transporter [Bacteroidota bacterium]|nr:cation diffusion facilitator family transporter [Bacteroidota bacterium]